MASRPASPTPSSLFDGEGRRLYLTEAERNAFILAAGKAPREVRTFCLVLAYTGCRISEALALTRPRVDVANQAIIFETLKKRRSGVFRAVPIPAGVLDALDLVHGLQEGKRRGAGAKKKGAGHTPADGEPRLWGWARKTAWQKVKAVMEEAGIEEGPHRCPKGLRHAYGVNAISKGIPLNLLSKWMGHASLEITAIYANALGQEQHTIAAKMWG